MFPQCENPRFTATHAPKQRGGQKKGGRAASEYGTQLLDKQRVRFTYNLRERQFARYVREAAEKKGISPAEYLFRTLESRLDNVVYRLGFAKSRAAARQMVSHGHVTVNGKKVTIPSLGVRTGNVIGIRDGSKNKALFGDMALRLKDYTAPKWLILDEKKPEGKVKDMPVPDATAGDMGNLTSVLEFYGR